jgi:hypothetical protein
VVPVDDVPLPEMGSPQPETDGPVPGSFSLGWLRSRFALGWAAAQFAFMASGFLYLALTGILDASRATRPLNLLFDIAAPLSFGALGIMVTVLTLEYMHAFTHADRPYLTISDDGLSVSNITRTLAWGDISRVFVYRRQRRATLVVWLAKGSRYHRRFWPFWQTSTVNLYVREPDKMAAMIRAHPGYRGEPDDA